MEMNLENLSKQELLKLIKDTEKELQKKDKLIEKQDFEAQNHLAVISHQNHLIKQLRRMLFGAKSEQFKTDLPALKEIPFEEYATVEEKSDETLVVETITIERKKNSTHKGRAAIPTHIPVYEQVIEPTEDTTGMVKIGEERTEMLEYVPEKFFKFVIVRPKYALAEKNQDISLNPTSKNVVIAEIPSRPIPKCLAGNALLTAILVNKYVDHLPLYRQQQIFKRSGIEIQPTTIDSWVEQLGKLLKVLYDKMVVEIKSQTYLQADETTTKVLDSDKKGKTHLGYYWTYYAPLKNIAVFDYQKGRSIDAPREILEDYEGALQTDGYNVYKYYYDNNKVIHLACWAHARRKFEQAKLSNKVLAEYVLTEIQKLYAIEREIKELSADEKKEIRLKKSLPIINALGQWMHEKRATVLPKSPIGMAIEYTTNLWTSLQNYLNDGNMHIDNNLIENTIRPIAIGRKNYLFAGSHNGAERSAMFYSFFATCKLNSINPYKWLEYVLDNIADYKCNKLHELLPNNINPEMINNITKNYNM